MRIPTRKPTFKPSEHARAKSLAKLSLTKLITIYSPRAVANYLLVDYLKLPES